MVIIGVVWWLILWVNLSGLQGPSIWLNIILEFFWKWDEHLNRWILNKIDYPPWWVDLIQFAESLNRTEIDLSQASKSSASSLVHLPASSATSALLGSLADCLWTWTLLSPESPAYPIRFWSPQASTIMWTNSLKQISQSIHILLVLFGQPWLIQIVTSIWITQLRNPYFRDGYSIFIYYRNLLQKVRWLA